MALGPGKYDPLCTQAREAAKAAGVILVIFDGEHGSGFSVQSVSLELTALLPGMLRRFATEIEDSFVKA